MKPRIISKKQNGQRQDKGAMKVIKSYKSGGILNVTVKIFQKSQSVKNLSERCSPLISPANSERSIKMISTYAKPIKKYNYPANVSPGDFIEPYEDLTIPSTIDYTSNSYHHPTKSMDEIIPASPRSAMRPPRPETFKKQIRKTENVLKSKELFRKTR